MIAVPEPTTASSAAIFQLGRPSGADFTKYLSGIRAVGLNTMEDEQMFTTLGQHDPQLAGLLARLREEHRAIKQLLDDLQELLSADEVNVSTLRAEVERLTAELESHLDYEEEQLIPVLDGVVV